MRSSIIIFLAAMGFGEAMAGPAHANLHRAVHQKKDVDYDKVDYSGNNFKDMPWDAMGINWSSALANAGSKPTATPTTSLQAAAVASAGSLSSDSKSSSAASSSSSSSSGEGSSSQLWNGIEGVSNDRTAFGGRTSPNDGVEVSYIGNHGIPHGANAMFVDSTEGYDYTITVKNTQSKAITVNMWNKAGSDGKANSGATSAPKDTVLTVHLEPEDHKIMAFDENSQIALCEATDNLHSSGAFATTWAEVNMVNLGPAYDVTAILNNGTTYKMSITSEEVDCTSSETENSWVTETQTIGSGDCWIKGTAAHITVALGGY